MPTVVIADDENLQRGSEALAAIAEHQPDVAFLDIRMPALSGLDVARASNGRCRVVFTTAHDEHAIEAFGLGALDYLLKPIALHRLIQTVERLRWAAESPCNPSDSPPASLAIARPSRFAHTLEWLRHATCMIN